MSRKWQGIGLAAASAASLLAAVPAAFAAILSPMALDPARSGTSPAAWLAFALVVSLWAVCLLAPYGAWVAFSRRRTARAWLVMAAPLFWAAAAAACMALPSR